MISGITVDPKLRLKHLLDQNEVALATFVTLQGSRAAQVIAHTGLDAVIIDQEHGHIGDSEMHDMVVAVSGSGVSPIVRIAGLSGMLIKRALDTGAHGIMVPTVNSAEEARSAVSWAKFPPVGVRGQGSPFACFEHGLATPSEYVAKANAGIITMIQIETRAGVENIDQICEVEGVDLLFIGPNDLALALLGYTPAKYTETCFLEAIDKVVESAHKHGKKVGILSVDGEAAKKAKERFDMVVLSNDVRSLQAWYSKELKLARS
ncbi:Pyruvate/Phosphoenolpyruvate kinase-like domain-containing protein [Exophiala viscosa]|uniref:Pyruvate/Phosphoenolpyruvate kinase-like domain-containing protein n=1 Tax=Exophiala viscosa TaxID=2486360 RepID=A0AAN6IIJ5_9EURO|nr:Pyruvate/Phosphoenolpyruvate kinase-like domain-containing protein [Exophiala viscosa]KAI1627908.1 Pyruvate/Phosphoenolpyruvate kinase-like domain-containing protein [Exophiala viscosa]